MSFRSTATATTASIEGGLAVTPQLLVGVEASGWLIEPGNLDDPTKGRAISRYF
jgi:hypothetical protein